MKTIYKSELPELASKEFTSVEELEAAEARVSEAIAARQKAAEERKSEAEVVKAAITARIQAERKARQARLDAYKVYLQAIDEANAEVEELKKAEAEAIKKFTRKYGGFHDYITIDDVTYSVDYSVNESDPFSKLLQSFIF